MLEAQRVGGETVTYLMHEVFKSELKSSIERFLVIHLEVEPIDVVTLVLSIRAVRAGPDIILQTISNISMRQLVKHQSPID